MEISISRQSVLVVPQAWLQWPRCLFGLAWAVPALCRDTGRHDYYEVRQSKQMLMRGVYPAAHSVEHVLAITVKPLNSV